MAFFSFYHLFLFFLLSQISLCFSQITSVKLPVSKDAQTGQYLTRIYFSGSTEPTKLVLDLGGSSLWLDCGSTKPNPVLCRSIQCSSARFHSCPTDTTQTQDPPCSVLLRNPVSKVDTYGELVEDSLAVESPTSFVDQFLFSCGESFLLRGLATGARGVLGLGNTRLGAPSQISHLFGYPQKFSLCLSSSNGMLFTGGQHQSSFGKIDISKSLIYTPLLSGNDDYFIKLKAIKIKNKKLSIGLSHKVSPVVKISTVIPYSQMETQIYRVFLKAFVMAAESSNMTRVSAVSPFEACYFTDVSTVVPVVDLVLQSEMVKWRIYGHNSMVKVKDDVMCLGVLDGGSNLEASIVLGGHQLEDNLLEFDLGSSMLGFSSSLIVKQTSCSHLSSSSANKDVQIL